MSRHILDRKGERPRPWKIVSACGLSVLLLFGQTAPVMGNPTGGDVVAGNANIGSAGATLTINQTSNNAIINWQQFSIANGEMTKFLVPGSTSATLNRVLGGNPSAIYGTLQSNGVLYLVNPNGIVVGPNGRIDTAGFIGSTLDISNDQFLKGDLHFTGNSDASIDNAGIIHSSTGDVYLIANQVNNTGTLSAPQGTVGLAAGSDVLFQQAGTQHLFIKSTPTGTTRATGVTNSGSIQAAAAELKAARGNAYALAINNTGAIAATGYKKVNGQVYLTAEGGNITNSGTITAKTKSGNGGTIVLNGHGTTSSGTVLNTGTLDASGKGTGKVGGTVQVLGNRVGIADHGVVDVSGDAGGGTALIGGDEHGANPAIANADQTYLGPDATINANALTFGNGGKVILWSNLSTQAYGGISVRGGTQGGDGGFVETSGLHLDLQMAPQIGAPHGKGGTWLLDPTDVTITDATGADNGFSPTGSNPTMFYLYNDNATITQATLLSELQSGSVLIDASSGGSGNAAVGTITWSQPNNQAFDIGLIPANTLTLNAAGQIYLNGITIKKVNASDTGSLNLVLNDQSYTQGNVLVVNSTIKLNGGNFTANGIGFASTTASTSLGGSDGVDIYSSTIDAQGGNIILNGQAGYFQNSFFGPTSISAGTGVIVNVSLLQTSGTGNITITGDGSIPTVDTNSNPISSASSLTGVSIGNQVYGGGSAAGSLITVVDGTISITGKVKTGDLGDTAGGGEIHGVEILANSVISTTGVAGTDSITVVGNTNGSSNELGDNIGVYIDGTDFNTATPTPHTAIIQVGTGSNPSTGGGISITGTGGAITTSSAQNSSADGFDMSQGASIIATGSAPISITGYGGSNTNTDSSNTGEAVGVNLSTDKYGSNYISSDSGDITITGTAGSSASAGIGILLAGTQATPSLPLVTTTIETQSTGSIYITGYGDSSYAGSGYIVGQYVPNYGVAIADYATLHTDVSGAALNVSNNEGLISITGIGSSNSYGVGIEQLPAGTFDLLPVQPTITAGGELLVTAFQSDETEYTGIYINNANINAAIATFGTGTTNDVTSTYSGALDIENSTITLGGGDFTAYGQGNLLNLNGITINGTTIDTQGGQYFLTGGASYQTYNGPVTALNDLYVAGEGVLIKSSSLQAENSASMSIYGDASIGNTVENSLVGVDIPDSSLTVQNGRILIQGTVNSGTAKATTLAESAGFKGYGVRGVNLGDSSSALGATIQATGTGGSIAIVGNASGSTSDALDSSHDNVGVSIQNNLTKVTSAGNGVAFVGSTTYNGVYIEGESGDLINNQFDSVAGSASGTEGVRIHDGATVTGTGASDITLIGQSGTNSMLNSGDTVGDAIGVGILADATNGTHANGNTLVSTVNGNVLIKGTGNTSPSKGLGVALVGVEGSSASVISTTGNITMSGFAGSGNTGGSGDQFLPNFGVVIGDKAVVQTGSAGTIDLSGVGAGANNAGVEIVRLPTSFDSMSVAPQVTTTTGSFNITTTGGLVGTDIVLDGASVNAGSATFTSAGEVLMVGSTLTLNGNFTASGTATTNDAFVNDFGDLGGPFIPNGDGVYMAVSSITSQGGNINLTGQAGYQFRNFGSSGSGNVAGVGVVLTSATLQTIGTGGITIIGHGGVGNVQIADDMNGVFISNFQFLSTTKGPSNLSVADGLLSISGDVASGTSLEAPPFNTSADGTGPNGVYILAASTISATGSKGSVSIVGDTTGSYSDATDTTNNNHDNTGVRITGTGTNVSSAGSGGIFIQGYAGDILNNQVGGTGSTAGAAAADGIKIAGGATIQSTGTGNITMTGIGGTNNTLGGAVLGSAVGVSLTSNESNSSPDNGNTLITAASGNITITGTGGTSPNEGTGIVVAGRNGAHTTIDPVVVTTSGITLNGTGGSGNTGPGGTTYPGVIYGYNAGILIVGDARLQNTGTSGITLTGAGGGTTKYGVLVNPFPAGTSTTTTAPTIQAGTGPLNVTANVGKILFTSTGTSGNPISAGSATFVAADTLDTSTSFFSVPGVFTATTVAGDLTLGPTTVGQLILNSGANLILGTENATSAIALDAYNNGTISQTGSLTTSLLSILGGNGITLNDSGNSIPFLGTVSLTGPQTFTFLTNQALSLVGLVSGDGLMNIVTTGGDLTIAPTGQVTDLGTGANVVLAAGLNLAGSHYFINNSSMGANGVQVSSGASYSIFSSDPTATQLGGLVPDITLYGATFIPASGTVTSNGVLYYAAQGAVGPNALNNGPPNTGSGSNIVPPVLTPQPVFPTVPPINNNGGPNPPPFSFTGDGTSGQIGTTTGGLADSSGNSGQIGTGDVAQLNGGQLNNVTDPAAAGALNQALGPAVHSALADALKTIGDYNAETTGSGDASAGNGETILTGGDFGEIGGSDVQKIPASQAPPQLQNALGNGVLNNLPSGGGAGAGH